jgi:hypothetical protein
MGRSPLGRARLIATLGGIVLLAVMFLPWFGAGVEGAQVAPGTGGGSEAAEANAWEAFDFIDIVLLAAALIAIAPAVAFLVAGIELPPAANALAAGVGLLATLLVLFRLISPPEFVALPPGVTGLELDISRKFGAFLGLIAAAAVTAGGALAAREELRALRPSRRGAVPRSPEL